MLHNAPLSEADCALHAPDHAWQVSDNWTPCSAQVLYFVSAYLMINDHNHIAVYAVQEDAW
jgi:hypothetical protein